MAFKYFNFRCTRCECEFEALVGDEEAGACPKCGDSEYVERAATASGGYHIRGDNSASVRPRGAGAFRRGNS